MIPDLIVQRCVKLVIILAVVTVTVMVGAVTERQERSFQNLEVLDGVSTDEVELIMRAVSLSLGVECVHCHEPGAFEQDVRPTKETARSMMRMVEVLSSTTFEVLEVPSCWTCHRGSLNPEVVPPASDFIAGAPELPFSSRTEPAGQVYENVTTYVSLPANELREVMLSYTQALGVGCDHCHILGNWGSDEVIVKQLARVMAEMQQNLRRNTFEGQGLVSCWTCHRGEVTPQSNVPLELTPVLVND